MFAVIYKFKIHPEKEDDFVQSWSDLTEFIKTHEGGLGSRLHKSDPLNFYAYAQWQTKETWEKSGDKLTQEALDTKKIMRQCCEDISTEISMEMVKDLLINPTIGLTNGNKK
jgi:quinol monooxygenase YgiN